MFGAFRSIAIVACATLYLFLMSLPAKAGDFNVRFVLVLSRHGVRSPTATPAALATLAKDPWPDFGVPPGFLTAHGFVLATLMGAYYREALAARGLVAPSGCADESNVYFASDLDERTVKTAQGYAQGMFPSCAAPAVHYRTDVDDDPVFHPIAGTLWNGNRALAVAALRGRSGSDLSALRAAYADAISSVEYVTRRPIPDGALAIEPGAGEDLVRIEGPFDRAQEIAEILQMEYANGFPMSQVGWGRATLPQIVAMSRVRPLYYELTQRAPYVASVKGSNLLSHVLATLEQAAENAGKPGAFGPAADKVTFVVGHDGNIANVAGLLGVSWVLPTYQPNDAAPGGALIFEVGTRASDGTPVVRLSYTAATLDQMRDATKLSLANPPPVFPLFVRGCSTADDGYPCPFADFERVARSAIDPAFVTP